MFSKSEVDLVRAERMRVTKKLLEAQRGEAEACAQLAFYRAAVVACQDSLATLTTHESKLEYRGQRNSVEDEVVDFSAIVSSIARDPVPGLG